MKLQTKYLLFVITLHTAALVMSYYIFLENKLWFLLAELFLALYCFPGSCSIK
jgi:two-component system nitrogen regulation sensor histidine kinase NtrY